jgi:hypothetical protein
MAIETRSAFIYGHTITEDNQWIDFSEDGIIELSATIEVGSYTLDQFKDAVATALNEIGDNTYTVAVDRATRTITINSDANVQLLVTGGSHVSISAYSLIGFTTDRALGLTHIADTTTGSIYYPQAPLYGYMPFENNESSVSAKVNESSSGDIELVTYGTRKFMECNIKYATNITGQNFITDNATGVSDLNTFMQYIRLKRPIEFCPDKDTLTNFYPCIIERTAQSGDGTKYELMELYAEKLANYYETGIIVFRSI